MAVINGNDLDLLSDNFLHDGLTIFPEHFSDALCGTAQKIICICFIHTMTSFIRETDVYNKVVEKI